MLTEYEEDVHTGMDIPMISESLRFYTGGYPYLVSWLCKYMDEECNGEFTKENLEMGIRRLLIVKTPLFDDLSKKVHDYADLADMLKGILLSGKEYPFTRDDVTIDLGATFGIFIEKDGKTAVSNIIFETRLYNLFLLQRLKQQDNEYLMPEKSQFITEDCQLDMPQVLRKFQEVMYAEYRESDEKFYERQGGLLFLCFLKPIINGSGNYFVEPRTRNNSRMDIVVYYGRTEYIIELKIWHGEKYREKGLSPLADYMESRNVRNGYLVSFNFNENKEKIAREVEAETKNGNEKYLIYEVVV